MEWIDINKQTPEPDRDYIVLSHVNWYYGGNFEANPDGTTLSIATKQTQPYNIFKKYTAAFAYTPEIPKKYKKDPPVIDKPHGKHYLVLVDSSENPVWKIAFRSISDEWNTSEKILTWEELPDIPKKYKNLNIKWQRYNIPANTYLRNMAYLDYCKKNYPDLLK